MARMGGETGVLWFREPGKAEIFLVVVDGRVTDCTPHAESWALGRTSGPILARAEQVGAEVRWMPTSTPPRRFETWQEPIQRLRRWRAHLGRGQERYLTFGRTGDGWFIDDSDLKVAFAYTLRVEAEAELARRMEGLDWRPKPADYGPDGKPLPNPHLPD